MRYPASIDATATDPILRLPLQWEADSLYVGNPTKYTVLVRVGSGSRPKDTTDADLIIPPVSAQVLPVAAHEFFLLLSTPTLTDAPDGMPSRVSVIALKNEPPIALGAISLAGQRPAAGVQVDTISSSLIVSHPAVAVPAAIRRLMISPRQFSGALARVEIYGNQTGTQYYQGTPGNGFAGHTLVELSALDTTLEIDYFPQTTGAYQIDVFGFSEYGPIGAYGQDGKQLVVSYPDVPAPTVQVRGILAAPVANTLICTTGALAAGDYRIEAEMGCSDLPAAVNRYMYLVLNSAAPVQDFLMPAPGTLRAVWSRVTVAASQAVEIRSGGVAGVAGSFYQGAIRAYKLA